MYCAPGGSRAGYHRPEGRRTEAGGRRVHVWYDGGDAAAGDAGAVCAARVGPRREGGLVRGYVREGVHPSFVRGRGVWMQETADIVAKVLADHPERAVRAGLSERVEKDGGERERE